VIFAKRVILLYTVTKGVLSGQDFYSVFHGLDRVDSKCGYSPDNLVTCCFDCNRMKSDFTLEFFIEHIERIFKHGEKTSYNSPN
jgi:hypothetical protein